MDYGDRYFGSTYSGRVSHRTRRTTLSLDASRDITNRRDSRLDDSFFFLVDQNGHQLSDPNTNQPIVVNIPNLEETDEDFLNTQVRGAISVIGRRTSASLSGTVSNRQFEDSNDEEDSYDVSLNVSRQLGRTVTLGAGFTIRLPRREPRQR